MLIQLQPQHLAIFELELELFAVEPRIVLVDDPVVVRTDDNDIRGVIVLRTGEVVDVVGCEQRAHRHRNGHPAIQQRPVHRLLQYESIIVIHQSYISFFYTLVYFLWSSYCLLGVFLPSSYPNERLDLASRTSPQGLGLLSARSILRLRYDLPTTLLR